MKELSERDKALIIDGIPEANLVLFCPGLQGHGTTLLDRSKYANNGAITGASWVRLPRGLYVLQFNGTSNFVSLGTNAALYPAVGSIEVWAKNTRGNADTPFFGITNNSANWMYLGQSGPTFIGFSIKKSNTWYMATAIANPDITSFHHWVGVFDGTNMTLYKDGVATTPGAASGVGLNHLAGSTVWLERMGSTGTVYGKGQLALARLYSRALTSTEVTRRFTRGRHLFGV